jgi:hypothetical protein
VLVLQAIPQVIVNEFYSRKIPLVVDAAMALHEDDAQQLGDAGGRPQKGCIIDDTAPKCLPSGQANRYTTTDTNEAWFFVLMQFALYLLFEYSIDERCRHTRQRTATGGENYGVKMIAKAKEGDV